MGKLLLKYWIINVLFSLSLFILYRLLISEKNYPDSNGLDFLFNILDILVNLGFSLIFLILLPVCSLTFFLNLTVKIRKQFYLSLLTFTAIPAGVLIYVLTAFMDTSVSGTSLLTTASILTMVYLIFTSIQFRVFRKRQLSLAESDKSPGLF
ncbi:hypothetical protein [Chryseobacterium sp. Leaf394]|uniref:hypothetical protein n=1 Tax=Chryseobacterium sp. Leaf394 TaxID=1736361 RepID=UPI0006FA83D0|nr:hypothetical protein [Chryseobacterium sp. Leaf394]KQS91933.1 hypothetical protein ASG21_05605 [Chryseobacterium sp. Leaf394]